MASTSAAVNTKDHEDSTSDDESNNDAPVESLIAGRTKRATAGNRLSSLIEKEADDDLTLLFAEDEEEEDVEFAGDEDEVSDVQMDSSSDDEDQGPAVGGDELEGEKELQKQDKAERKKKAKARDPFKRIPVSRNRFKVDPTTLKSPTTPAARLKKKSERISWLPTQEEGPVRSSSRKQTMQNKEAIHMRMQENEKRRRRQLKTMEATAKKKEAAKPKAITQADRIAEAARTEKGNAKSLNRWEESEKKRLEEQKARLDGLHNRQLKGPVISSWSGPAKWVSGKLVTVGIQKVMEKVKDSSEATPKGKPLKTNPESGADVATQNQDTVMSEASALKSSFLTTTTTAPAMTNSPKGSPKGSPIQPSSTVDSFSQGCSPGVESNGLHSQHQQLGSPPQQSLLPMHGNYTAPITVPLIEYSTRNLVILENIDGNATKIPELQNHVLLKKRTGKLQKMPSEICAITGHTARFRDPSTGLAYANSYAFKEIQKLRNGGSRWSNLLECYVGPISSAAKGVPEQFLKKA